MHFVSAPLSGGPAVPFGDVPVRRSRRRSGLRPRRRRSRCTCAASAPRARPARLYAAGPDGASSSWPATSAKSRSIRSGRRCRSPPPACSRRRRRRSCAADGTRRPTWCLPPRATPGSSRPPAPSASRPPTASLIVFDLRSGTELHQISLGQLRRAGHEPRGLALAATSRRPCRRRRLRRPAVGARGRLARARARARGADGVGRDRGRAGGLRGFEPPRRGACGSPCSTARRGADRVPRAGDRRRGRAELRRRAPRVRDRRRARCVADGGHRRRRRSRRAPACAPTSVTRSRRGCAAAATGSASPERAGGSCRVRAARAGRAADRPVPRGAGARADPR